MCFSVTFAVRAHVVQQYCNHHHSTACCWVQLQATSRHADTLETLLLQPCDPLCDGVRSGVSAVKSHLCLVFLEH